MLKARYHKLRLQFSLWRCRVWNSCSKWWETKASSIHLTKRGLLGTYLLLMLLIGTILMSRFQAKLGEGIDAGDKSSVVGQQGSVLAPEDIWDEPPVPSHPEPPDPVGPEPQQLSQAEAEAPPGTLVNSEPEQEQPAEPVLARSARLEELLLPLVGDAPVLKEFSLSAKSATLGDWRPHLAVDFAAPAGATVQAAAAGTVSKLIVKDAYWGTIIIIDHGGGWSTSYSNIANPTVKVGERVAAGHPIGQITENPPLELLDPLHLHFILLQDEQPLDPCSLWHK